MSDDQHLVEHRVSRQEILKGDFLHAFRDTVVLPDGGSATREFVIHPGAVMIIPLLADEQGNLRVVLERQFRYPLHQIFIELPAGKIDTNEHPLDTARRELREETGVRAASFLALESGSDPFLDSMHLASISYIQGWASLPWWCR